MSEPIYDYEPSYDSDSINDFESSYDFNYINDIFSNIMCYSPGKASVTDVPPAKTILDHCLGLVICSSERKEIINMSNGMLFSKSVHSVLYLLTKPCICMTYISQCGMMRQLVPLEWLLDLPSVEK